MNLAPVNLGEFFRVKHGFAFKGHYFTDSGDHVVLTPGNFHEEGGFRRRLDKDRYYAGDIPENFVLKQDDLIVAMTEQGPGLLGSSAWIPDGEQYLHNQRLGLIVDLDENRMDKRFLYYLFNTRSVRGQLSGSASGTKVRHTAPERIYRVQVSLPDIAVQKKIAETITAYDDLIENNRRRIALLEEAARQLYKEWFVRFRFPGHEHVPIVDGVPEGWSLQRLTDLAELTMGQSPKSEFYNDTGDGLPFHQGVTNFGFRYVSHKTYCTKPTRLSQPGDILFSVRAPVGRMNMTVDQIVLGRGISAMRSRTGHQSFLFYQLKSFFFKEDMVGGGAIYAAVNKKQLENQELLCPPKNLIEQFDEFASSVDRQIKVLTNANEQLTKARDILIPKLMSGEIVV